MFLVVNERKELNIWKSVLIWGDIRPGKRTGRDARGSITMIVTLIVEMF